MSGGRYDGLLEMFGAADPAVGIGLGVDRLFAALVELKLVTETPSPTRALVVLFDAEGRRAAYAVGALLREAGINAEVFLGTAKMKKQFRYADQRGIPYVIVAGPDERAEGVVKIKTMATGDQQTVALADLAATLQG
jgi:histidyl-tRNA synthetase